jgi:tryptophanyl-tRNA synthetase
VLQAADILIVRADLVPVGKDQKQHVEVARDIAQRFNATYGAVLSNPEPYIPEDVATVPGIDGRKMSKSYGNTIELFAPEKKVRSQIMAIVTDSKSVDEPKDPTTCNVFGIFRLLLNADERREWEGRYRAGGMGYGDVKKALFERFLDSFGPMRRRREELARHPDQVESALREGARRMREVGLAVVDEVRDKVGLPPH